MGDYTTDYRLPGEYHDDEETEAPPEPQVVRRGTLSLPSRNTLPVNRSAEGFPEADFSLIERAPSMTDLELTKTKSDIHKIITNIATVLDTVHNPTLMQLRSEWYDVLNPIINEMQARPTFARPITAKERRAAVHLKTLEATEVKRGADGNVTVINPPKSPEEIELMRLTMERQEAALLVKQEAAEKDRAIRETQAQTKEVEAKAKLIQAETTLFKEQRLASGKVTDQDLSELMREMIDMRDWKGRLNNIEQKLGSIMIKIDALANRK